MSCFSHVLLFWFELFLFFCTESSLFRTKKERKKKTRPPNTKNIWSPRNLKFNRKNIIFSPENCCLFTLRYCEHVIVAIMARGMDLPLSEKVYVVVLTGSALVTLFPPQNTCRINGTSIQDWSWEKCCEWNKFAIIILLHTEQNTEHIFLASIIGKYILSKYN